MKFQNRNSAGLLLGKEIEKILIDQSESKIISNILVVGLPRGGMPVAFAVAQRLKCALDIIVAKKLPYPGQPEYAIGAVSSDGVVELDPAIPHDFHWQAYIDTQRQELLIKTRESESRFRQLAGVEELSLENKTVIIVDDGIATGMTVKAAIKSAKLRGCSHLIVAAPAMSYESYLELQSLCDQVIALITPDRFGAVGQYYVNFAQTSDQEVIAALRDNRSKCRPPYIPFDNKSNVHSHHS